MFDNLAIYFHILAYDHFFKKKQLEASVFVSYNIDVKTQINQNFTTSTFLIF